ncbi:hypothetical protein [Nonomuraea sp. NPDC048826]|uniref:hypothetical protein n=1 Tax=Nonomuraea sp. NPDC048826 TaxID=3364347 RepID=UPI00371EBA40
MASRGFVGFVADQTQKIAYNHYDSAPDGIGLLVLAWLRTAVGTPDVLRERVAALRVATSGRPTADDIERYGQYADPHASTHEITWMELLWQTQGDPEAMLRAGVIADASSHPVDHPACEWGYLVDLDSQVFEVYRGGQAAPHNRGRFAAAHPAESGHWPVALVMGWRFDQLPSDEEFLTAL